MTFRQQPKTVIFDIDGTLADLTHRRHYVANRPKNWNKFFAELHKDTPIKNVVSFCQFLMFDNPHLVNIIFCTGRGEEYRAETMEWLKIHVFEGLTRSINLKMRPAKDSRPDDIIKKEMLDAIRAEGHDLWFVVDDRQRVVDMWRANGVTVFQSAPGDFDKGDPQFYEPIPGETLLHLMVGPSGGGKSSTLANMVARGELAVDQIVSSDAIRQQMFGDFRDQSNNPRVFAYLHDTVKTRMNYGLKTVIDATHLHRQDRLSSVALAPEGTIVKYVVIDRPLSEKMKTGGWRLEVDIKGKTLVESHDQKFKSALKDILAGDNLPNVRVSDLRY
jgi:hypothetical protein